MNVVPLEIPAVLRLEPTLHRDERGHFCELWKQEACREWGLPERWLQDNLGYSKARVVRGLHIQHPNSQGKLVSVPHGEILDVAVDLRRGSPTFGKHVWARLNDHNRHALFIPPGFAHGYSVLSSDAVVTYKVSERYSPPDEFGVRWDDPDIGVDWQVDQPILSPKDRAYPFLRDIAPDRLPVISDFPS